MWFAAGNRAMEGFHRLIAGRVQPGASPGWLTSNSQDRATRPAWVHNSTAVSPMPPEPTRAIRTHQTGGSIHNTIRLPPPVYYGPVGTDAGMRAICTNRPAFHAAESAGDASRGTNLRGPELRAGTHAGVPVGMAASGLVCRANAPPKKRRVGAKIWNFLPVSRGPREALLKSGFSSHWKALRVIVNKIESTGEEPDPRDRFGGRCGGSGYQCQTAYRAAKT